MKNLTHIEMCFFLCACYSNCMNYPYGEVGVWQIGKMVAEGFFVF
jgi:hypothetical protein